MAKFTDEVQLIMSARDEQIDAMRKAERNAIETERRQARREKESIERAKSQFKQRERVEKEGYDKAEQNAREGGNRVASAFESPLIKAALRATAAFGSLELGLGGVNALVGVMKGDLQGAAEAVKQLPAGIGPFARQLETLLGTVTGITAEISKINMVTANMAASSAARSKSALADLRAQAAEQKTLRDLRQDTELRGITDNTAKQRRAEELRAENAIQDLNAEIQELQRKRLESGTAVVFSDQEQARIDELRNDLRIFQTRRKEALEAGFDEGNSDSFLKLIEQIKATEKELESFISRKAAVRSEIDNLDKQIERAEQRRSEITTNNAARAAEVERDIAAKRAEQKKQEQERDKMDAVKAAGERAKALEKIDQDLAKKLEDIQKQYDQRRIERYNRQIEQVQERASSIQEDIQRLTAITTASVPKNTADERRFLTGVSDRSATEDRIRLDPQRQALEEAKKMLAELKKQSEDLKELVDAIKAGPRVVGGVFSGGSN